MLRNPIAIRHRAVTRILNAAYDNGGGTVLVDGLTGMGKTFLLREFARQARERALWKTFSLSADRFESSEPYCFMERFLSSGFALDWDFQPDKDHQPIALARECVRRLLDSIETGGGRVIIIDDAHWIDAESARVLRHMIPRLNRRNILVVCAARTPHEPSSFGQILADTVSANPQDTHFPLTPLSEEEIRALAFARFGISIAKRHAAEISTTTGGSFRGVDSILDRVTPEEIDQLHTRWDFPIRGTTIKNPLLGTYHQLSTGAQELAQIVCLAENGVSPSMLRMAAEKLEVPYSLEEAIEAGILMESNFGKAIVPVDKHISSGILGIAQRSFVKAVHSVYSELTEGFCSVQHMIRGAEHWNADLEQRLNSYVAEATHYRQVPDVMSLLRMALELATEPETRQHLITDLVLINLRVKTGFLCLDLLDEIETFPYSTLREFMVVMLGQYVFQNELPQHRVRAVLEAPGDIPDEAAIQAFLMFVMVMRDMRISDRSNVAELLSIAHSLLQNGPQDPRELADQRLTWMVIPGDLGLILESYELLNWQLNGEIESTKNAIPYLLERVLKLKDASTQIDCMAPLAAAAIGTGNVIQARDIAGNAIELFPNVEEGPWTGNTPRIIHAHALLLLGQYEEAKHILDNLDEVIHEGLDIEARLTSAALRASIATITATEDPKVYSSIARRVNELDWEHYGRDLSIMAKLERARAAYRAQEVVEIASMPKVEMFAYTQRGFLTYKTNALITLGRLDEARAAIDDIQRRRGTTWFEYWGTLDWLQARLAEALDDPKAARILYKSAITQKNYPLPWALTAIDYGTFLHAQGKGREAETMLRKAMTTLEEVGAEAYLPDARHKLHTVTTHNQHTRVSLLDGMTQRELEVAALLAEGQSNQGIANELVVSLSTARFHVSNILRKLNLTSRAEVPGLLQISTTQSPADETPLD